MRGKKYKSEGKESLVFEFSFQSLAAHICFSIASLAFFISLISRDFPSIVGSFSLMLFFALHEHAMRKRYLRKGLVIELWGARKRR